MTMQQAIKAMNDRARVMAGTGAADVDFGVIHEISEDGVAFVGWESGVSTHIDVESLLDA